MKFLTRKLVTHEDLNPRGYLHGGQLLKWIDEEGGIHAGIELNTGLIVTKMISEIDFTSTTSSNENVILNLDSSSSTNNKPLKESQESIFSGPESSVNSESGTDITSDIIVNNFWDKLY